MEIINFPNSQICRFCLRTDQSDLENLYTQSSVSLSDIISFANIPEIKEIDNLPDSVCVDCLQSLVNIFLFRLKIITSDQNLRNRVYIKENDETNDDDVSEELEESPLECNQENDDDSESCPNISGMKYECRICCRGFNMKCRYENHIKIHGKYTEKCTMCEKMFTNKRYLTIHMKIHTNTERFTCNLCNKIYSSKSNLGKHKRISHSSNKMKEKHFLCHICSKTFISSTHLKNHLQIHTHQTLSKDENAQLYHCDECGKGFTTKVNLKKHLIIHSDISFPCKICVKTFRQQKHLNEHMIVHSDVKSFGCNLCSKRFARHNQLKVHLNNHTNSTLIL